MGTPARKARVAQVWRSRCGAGSVDVACEQLPGPLGRRAVPSAGEGQVVILLVGGPDGTGGDPLLDLTSSVVVEDGDGAGIEGDGAFAVVALGVALPDDDAVGDGDGLADREPCAVEVDVAPPQRERFGSSQAGGGDEEPQGVVPVAGCAAVVEEGDELLAGPAVAAGVS
jgi:hypothetical protein